jgi:hypothetical protein
MDSDTNGMTALNLGHECSLHCERVHAPTLTDSQRQMGAAVSRALRSARADVKRQLAARELTLGEALDRTCTQGMKVRLLLLALPYVGQVRANAILESAGIPLDTTVRRMGERQRAKLLGILLDR